MVMDTPVSFFIGFTPFLLVLAGFLAVAIVSVFLRTPSELITKTLTEMGAIWFVTAMVMILVTQVCLNVRPTEAFTSAPVETFNALEADTCNLIRTVIQYKQGEIGSAGLNNPLLVADAIHEMTVRVNGPMTECTPKGQGQDQGQADSLQPLLVPTGVQVSEDMFFSDPAAIQDRLDRMERTLTDFVLPQAKTSFLALNTCGLPAKPIPEPPAKPQMTDTTQPALVDTITYLQTLSDYIHRQFIDPIEQKQADLKAGRLSDCDRQKGASAGLR